MCHCPALVASQEPRVRAGVRTRVQLGSWAEPVKSHGPKTGIKRERHENKPSHGAAGNFQRAH